MSPDSSQHHYPDLFFFFAFEIRSKIKIMKCKKNKEMERKLQTTD